MSNKKIKNAQEIVYNNITFKSKLELNCYLEFKKNNIDLNYESKTFILLPKFKLTNGLKYEPFKIKKTKVFGLNLRVIEDCTYTPDFYIEYNGIPIFIETKGRTNDIYPLKKKLFLYYLEHNYKEYVFLEPHNLEQIKQSIIIVKNMTLLNKIYSKIYLLTKKDQKIAQSLITKRDFIGLYDLVQSSIGIKEKRLKTESNKEELVNLIGDLIELRGLIYQYLEQLDQTKDL